MTEQVDLQIPLDVEHKWIHYDSDQITIFWDNEQTTEVSREEFDLESDCTNCNDRKISGLDRLKLGDLCKVCYPQVKFGIPPVLNDFLEITTYLWQYPVSQTLSLIEGSQEGFFGKYVVGDLHGNHFGVGDEVLLLPRRDRSGRRIGQKKERVAKEGVAFEIHQYREMFADGTLYESGSKTFAVIVKLADGTLEFTQSANRIIALTETNVIYSNLRKIPDLAPKLAPEVETTLKEKGILDDPVAFAIYAGYRVNHISDSRDVDRVEKSALEISQELRKQPVPKDRLPLWFKEVMRPSVGIDIARFMVPYLTGERVATYTVKTS